METNHFTAVCLFNCFNMLNLTERAEEFLDLYLTQLQKIHVSISPIFNNYYLTVIFLISILTCPFETPDTRKTFIGIYSGVYMSCVESHFSLLSSGFNAFSVLLRFLVPGPLGLCDKNHYVRRAKLQNHLTN